jgi:hypothetical protein
MYHFGVDFDTKLFPIDNFALLPRPFPHPRLCCPGHATDRRCLVSVLSSARLATFQCNSRVSCLVAARDGRGGQCDLHVWRK